MMASVPRSQSARDMMRQEAKLHEMQEEVRRREARGAPALNSPNNGHYYPPGQHPAAMSHSRSHPQVKSNFFLANDSRTYDRSDKIYVTRKNTIFRGVGRFFKFLDVQTLFLIIMDIAIQN